MALGVDKLGLAVAVTFVASLALCAWLRAFALRRALVDRPNERSLHVAPVPRLGGFAIVAASASAIAMMIFVMGNADRRVLYWLGGVLAIAVLGGVDDVSSLSAAPRFGVQLVVSMLFALALELPRSIALTPTISVALPRGAALVLAAVWLVATLNIYNFLDGMDGLAAAQGAAAGVAISAASAVAGHYDLAAIAALMAAGTSGFFVHNAPPARIFMGDAGATYLGWGFAALALLGVTRAAPVPFLVVPVALAPFLLDGTFTLLRRALRGEAVWRAHRCHLYQRAVQTGLEHREVLIAYSGWIALAGACAVLIARGGPRRILVAVAVQLVAFFAVLLWVRGRESGRSERG